MQHSDKTRARRLEETGTYRRIKTAMERDEDKYPHRVNVQKQNAYVRESSS